MKKVNELTKEDFQIIDDDSEFYANAKLINIYSEKLGWRDKRDIIIQILQNQEDAEKWNQHIEGHQVAFIVDINNNYAMTEYLWNKCQESLQIVERLKERIEELEKIIKESEEHLKDVSIGFRESEIRYLRTQEDRLVELQTILGEEK